MAQTYTDWNKVPAPFMQKIEKMWNGSGTVSYTTGFDRNDEHISIYRLEDYKVAPNTDYLTVNQKIKLFDLSIENGVDLSNLVMPLSFEIETVRVNAEIYHLPNMVVGFWSHCNSYGAMDEDGRIHT